MKFSNIVCLHRLIVVGMLCAVVFGCVSSPSAKKAPALNPEKTAPQITALLKDVSEFLASGNRDGAFSAVYKASVLAQRTEDATLIELTKKERMQVWSFCSVELVSKPQPVAFGKVITKPFVVNVSVDNKPAAAFPLRVTGDVAIDGARAVTAAGVARSVLVTTGDDGALSLATTPKDLPGIFPVVVVVDTDVLFANASFSAEMSAFARADSVVPAVHTDWRIHTTNRTIPTSICIMDFNQDLTPVITDKDVTASALLFNLIAKKNYGAVGMSQFPKQMAQGDCPSAAAAAAEQFAGTVARFVCGTTTITDVTNSGDVWTAAADVTLYVFRLPSCEQVSVYSTSATASAHSHSAAITAVRRYIGETLLADSLFYAP